MQERFNKLIYGIKKTHKMWYLTARKFPLVSRLRNMESLNFQIDFNEGELISNKPKDF